MRASTASGPACASVGMTWRATTAALPTSTTAAAILVSAQIHADKVLRTEG